MSTLKSKQSSKILVSPSWTAGRCANSFNWLRAKFHWLSLCIGWIDGFNGCILQPVQGGINVENPATASGLKSKIQRPLMEALELMDRVKKGYHNNWSFTKAQNHPRIPSCWDNVRGWKPATAPGLPQRPEALCEFWKTKPSRCSKADEHSKECATTNNYSILGNKENSDTQMVFPLKYWDGLTAPADTVVTAIDKTSNPNQVLSLETPHWGAWDCISKHLRQRSKSHTLGSGNRCNKPHFFTFLADGNSFCWCVYNPAIAIICKLDC